MKIDFVYSLPYDNLISQINHTKVKNSEEIYNFIKKLSSKQKVINNLINNIEKITGLKFKENVKCYLISNSPWRGFSSPLTIRTNSIDEALSVLAHELIHVISYQNHEKISHLLDSIDKSFNLPQHTKTHIWVYLVEYKLREKVNLKDNPLKNLTKISSSKLRESMEESCLIAKEFVNQTKDENVYFSFLKVLKKENKQI